MKTRNYYRYLINKNDDCNKKAKIYSIQGKSLEDIFERFPQFKSVLLTRALRRQHYYRKLRRQQIDFFLLRHNRDALKNKEVFIDEILKIKKARLVEHHMSYEELISQQNFSEDEQTLDYHKLRIDMLGQIKTLKQVKRLQSQVVSLRKFSIEAMKSILISISEIDKGHRQLLYKHFDQCTANKLNRDGPMILADIKKFEREVDHKSDGFDSDDLVSDTSGNNSEEDEINKIKKLKQEALI